MHCVGISLGAQKRVENDRKDGQNREEESNQHKCNIELSFNFQNYLVRYSYSHFKSEKGEI